MRIIYSVHNQVIYKMAAAVQEAEVLLTENIRRWIRTVLLTEDLPNERREELRKYTSHRRLPDEKKPRTIPYELVKSVHQSTNQKGPYLHELLEGSEVHLPQLEAPERNPELERRIQKLKAEQEQKDYERWTSNLSRNSLNKKEYSETVGQQMRQMNNQLLSVFNFLVTVVGSFAFAYKATEYSMETPSFPLQLLSGLAVATVVFFADLYFLLKYYG